MAEDPIRAFVCGHPIAHSRSPLIHGYWLETLGIDGSYERIDVAPDDFRAFMERWPKDGFAGGNVTIPHKEAAFALAGRRDEAAEAIGAVNTLWIEQGVIIGGNTDAIGFAANLDDQQPRWRSGRVGVVLGAGGASRAVIHALLESGYREVRVVNRTLTRAAELADRFGARVSAHGWAAAAEFLADADLIVNATSLGMRGAESAPVDLSTARDGAVVTDIVYVPLETPFLVAARARGLAAADGLGMLLHQAVPGFTRWFGILPEVTQALRNRILTDLGTLR